MSPSKDASSKAPLLFTPLKIGNVQLKNRICITPMCQYSCVDGFVNDWHLVHLGARAIGGAGIVMVEGTAVEKQGRLTLGCTGIWKDEHIAPMARIANFIKEQNSVPAIQLAHSGRKASTYPLWVGFNKPLPAGERWQPIGPSAIAYGSGNDQVPLEATLDDINGFIDSFVNAAKRSVQAGFEIIELHFAYHCLVHSFLSPLSNKRTDQYGGSFENRIRLALNIVSAIKAALPNDFPLFVRITCGENLPNGWELADAIELAKRLKQLGVHLIDCHSDFDHIKMADIIQKEVDIAAGAVGGIVNAHWAEKILQQNKATLILIGRASLNDPNWPLHAAFELGATEHKMPNQYVWAIGENSLFDWRTNILKNDNQDQNLE